MIRVFVGLLYASALGILCYLAVGNQTRVSEAWFISGHSPADYALDVVSDEAIRFYARNQPPKGFATAMRRRRADSLRGKRVRLTAYVTTKHLAQDAALWMRVDGARGQMLALDNMDDRLITHPVDKRRYDIVLDVPAESHYIVYGGILGGDGELQIEELRLEVVGHDVPTTNQITY